MAECGEGDNPTLHDYELAFFITLKRSSELRTAWNVALALDEPAELTEYLQSLSTRGSAALLKQFYSKSENRLLVLIEIERVRYRHLYRYQREDEIFGRHLEFNNFTTLALDNLGRYLSPIEIPRAIFKLASVECLSLKNNGLRRLPADIGRMRSLKKLILTSNKLRSDWPALPFGLTFCERLETLWLDCNCLDAVPGLVTRLPALTTLYRHDNENYFRSTFMWYGWERKERIHPAWNVLPEEAPDVLLPGSRIDTVALATVERGGHAGEQEVRQPLRLDYLAARAVAQTKRNFFLLPTLSEAAKDYIADVYHTFSVCENCNTAVTYNGKGYYAFSFRSTFLGNTCVPFQHWACSMNCARAIERQEREVEMRDPALHYQYYHCEDPPQSDRDARQRHLRCRRARLLSGSAEEATTCTNCVVT